MKFFILLIALIAAVVAELYTTEYDHLDIQEIIKDKTLYKSFLDCFIDKIPCDEAPAHLKNDIPEAVQQACAKCTVAQKKMFKGFMEEMIKNYQTEYHLFVQKYDPDSKHIYQLMSALANS